MQRAARFAAWTVLVIAAYWFWLTYVNEHLRTIGRRHGEEAAVALGVAALTMAVFGYCSRPVSRWPGWFIGIIAVWMLVGFGVWAGHGDRSTGLVADYCAYGSVSEAQFQGCLDHADEGRIRTSNTNAARFARGEIEDCRADAGPYCEDALEWQYWDAMSRLRP